MKEIKLSPGETINITGAGADNPELFQVMEELYMGPTGVEIRTDRGVRVHVCHTYEVSWLIKNLLDVIDE